MNSKTKFIELKDPSEWTQKQMDEKVVLCDQLSSIDVLNLCLDKTVDHVVQKSNVHADNELQLSLKTVTSPECFFKYPISVIKGILDPTPETEKANAEMSVFLNKPSDKDTVLDQLETYIKQYCKRGSIASDIRIVADELISNSLFNAPYTRNSLNLNIARDYANITIDQNKKPHVFAGYDENRLIIGCTDFYGRLNTAKLMERIKFCYVNNPGEVINFNVGGAGIGSYMIFDACMSYYVAVDPGVSSTVCCTFPLNMSAKQRNDLPKNIHIINITPKQPGI